MPAAAGTSIFVKLKFDIASLCRGLMFAVQYLEAVFSIGERRCKNEISYIREWANEAVRTGLMNDEVVRVQVGDMDARCNGVVMIARGIRAVMCRLNDL